VVNEGEGDIHRLLGGMILRLRVCRRIVTYFLGGGMELKSG
jgi:hypothetical protein